MDHVYGLSIWIMYMDQVHGIYKDHVYGSCIWIMYMDQVHGMYMYMAPVQPVT